MSNWDKMDKKVYNNSVVFQELEKYLAENERLMKKQANISSVPQDLAKINQEAKPAAESLSKVETAVKSLYNNTDDEGKDNSEDEKDEFLLCLNEILDVIIDSGNTSLAYKLERYIKDLEDGLADNDDFNQDDFVKEKEESENV